MKATINDVEQIVSVLTAQEQQLLKDTIRYGGWGDADYTFLDENGETETVMMFGYCTNDAKSAGNFSGRKVSAMFRSIYRKLCPAHSNQIGRFVSHCNDWWGDAAEICCLSGKGITKLLKNGLHYETIQHNSGGEELDRVYQDLSQNQDFRL